jgi:hypothetical protein
MSREHHVTACCELGHSPSRRLASRVARLHHPGTPARRHHHPSILLRYEAPKEKYPRLLLSRVQNSLKCRWFPNHAAPEKYTLPPLHLCLRLTASPLQMQTMRLPVNQTLQTRLEWYKTQIHMSPIPRFPRQTHPCRARLPQ